MYYVSTTSRIRSVDTACFIAHLESVGSGKHTSAREWGGKPWRIHPRSGGQILFVSNILGWKRDSGIESPISFKVNTKGKHQVTIYR